MSWNPIETETHRGELDELYPPGTARTFASGPEAGYFGATHVSSGTPSDTFAADAIAEIESETSQRVKGYDRFARTRASGEGALRVERSVCDYVFFDGRGLIIRAYRSFQACAPLP